mmetsp:Transcript_11052/g.29208  ORF Transcript_11052/g.29208 Transcript_11052/m.29208 type:complete len:205 (-) Transcript_11052:589-1203(-)
MGTTCRSCRWTALVHFPCLRRRPCLRGLASACLVGGWTRRVGPFLPAAARSQSWAHLWGKGQSFGAATLQPSMWTFPAEMIQMRMSLLMRTARHNGHHAGFPRCRWARRLVQPRLRPQRSLPRASTATERYACHLQAPWSSPTSFPHSDMEERHSRSAGFQRRPPPGTKRRRNGCTGRGSPEPQRESCLTPRAKTSRRMSWACG